MAQCAQLTHHPDKPYHTALAWTTKSLGRLHITRVKLEKLLGTKRSTMMPPPNLSCATVTSDPKVDRFISLTTSANLNKNPFIRYKNIVFASLVTDGQVGYKAMPLPTRLHWRGHIMDT